jgi:uncharacterized protein (DUF1800 family)
MNFTTNDLLTKRPSTVVEGLTPYSGSLDRPKLIHLLRRTMFGVKEEDINYFKNYALSEVIDALITPPSQAEKYPAPPINAYNTAAKQDPTVFAGDTWVHERDNGNFNGERRGSFRYWWGGQMINQERTVFEKMVLFWHNHFAMEMIDTSPTYAYRGQVTLRENALGNFREFVSAITFDPQMLRYLNGYVNSKVAPDENYARELMELFTLGKGGNSQYTEDDVKAAARVLTGWRVRVEAFKDDSSKFNWTSYFNANTHDTGVKNFSSFFENASISGNVRQNTAANATSEIEDLLNMIFLHDEVSKFICRKIYRFFVYYEIDEQVEKDIIEPLAQIFRDNNYDIIPVLKALFSSEHFFEPVNIGCFIKSPIEYSVGIARTFNLQFPDLENDAPTLYTAWNSVIGTRNSGAATQGQILADPPNVSGWPAYYQEPFYHEAWVNTDTFPKRLRFVDSLLTDTGINLGGGKRLVANLIEFTKQFGNDAYEPTLLIERALEILYSVPVSQKFKDYLRQTILLDGQESDYYWTDAWDDYLGSPNNRTYFNIVNKKLQKFYKFIVDNTEFQLS